MSGKTSPHTLKYDDWIALGVDALRRDGPKALTIDTLCKRARRTKGSFYHHFRTIGELRLAVVRFWIEAEAEAQARNAASGAGARERLDEAWRPAPGDAGMEMGIRMLAADDAEIAALVAKADERRELVLTTLVASAWPVGGAHAHNIARTLHALHIAALMRAPSDPEDYARGPGVTLAWLVEGLSRR